MLEFRKLFERKGFTLLSVFLVVFATYLPVIDGYFLHTDDYFWSYWGGFTCPGVVNWILPIGRPLAGLIYCSFHLIQNFRLMAIFRFLAVCNIVLIGYLLWKWMLRWKVEGYIAFLVSVLIITLPSFQVFSAYISTIPHGLGVTFSLLSLFLATDSFEKKGATKTRLQIFSMLFLVVALCLNQASALYYIGALSVPLLMSESDRFMKEWARKLINYSKILIAGMTVYYLIFRLSAVFFTFRNVGKYDGRNFVQNYGKRFFWFLSHPFYEASNLWFVNPTYLFQTFVIVLMFFVIYKDFRQVKQRQGFLIKYTCILLLFPAGYGISMISSDPSTEYRTYSVIGSLFVFFIFLGFYYTELKRYNGKVRSGTVVVFSALAFMAVIVANMNVTKYFVLCDSSEFRYVKSEIRSYLESGKELKGIHFIIVKGPIAVAKQRNEVGEPTIRHTPNIQPLALAALSELGGPHLNPRITTGQSLNDTNWIDLVFNHETIDLRQDPYPPSKDGILIIDMSRINFL